MTHNGPPKQSLNGISLYFALLQPGVLGLDLAQQGDVWICVLPQCQEILIGHASAGLVVCHDISQGQAKLNTRHNGINIDNVFQVLEALEGLRRVGAAARLQVRIAAHIGAHRNLPGHTPGRRRAGRSPSPGSLV